ncbi:MAG: class I tRNA ligase family protein, partial [Gammaproteobacteria bacterium]|nr:class I tRNA ligase family protein [Gammaproteobacteria bacterium]
DRVAAMDVVSRQKTAGEKKTGVFTGGYCVNPATGAEIPIWIADYVLAGYGTGAIMAVPGHDERDFEFANEFGLPVVRVVAGPGEDADTPLDEAYTDHDAGRMVNSGRFDGMSVAEGKAAITADLAERKLGEKQVNYQLRDWCISRQRYWGPPIPIVYCPDPECGAVPVPERDLPVILPRVEDFKPDDDGVSPLARVESWYSVDCPACGAAARRETDVSDTFLDSSWYFLRYPSVGDDAIAFDPGITRRWLPVDSYIGGNEHAVLHLMYARFITMALHDIGLLDFEEPFTRFRAHGIIVKDGRKMSKTRGNVVTPDPVIEEFGADTFRLYLMFLGPFTEGGDYRDDGIRGPLGFLRRLWDTVLRAADNDADPDPRLEGQLHRTIEQVTRQIADLQYNTCISGMMEYLNAVRAGGRRPARAEIEPVVLMVAPFAPHIAEELWERLGHEGGVFGRARWPEYDAEKARRRIVKLAVQVNGKVRGTIEGPSEMSREDAETLARQQENVARFLENGSVRRVIYVPGRLINLVVG